MTRGKVALSVAVAIGLAWTPTVGAHVAGLPVLHDSPDPGTVWDVSDCVWSENNIYDGQENGSSGIDLNAFYGLPHLEAHVDGGHWRIRGEFPRARWFGFQAYSDPGYPVSYVPDSEMVPDPGSVNPFRAGAAWQPGRVSYTLDIVDAPPDQRDDPPYPNTLWGGWTTTGVYTFHNQIEYRIYLPVPRTRTRPLGSPGGVGLPRVEFVVDDPATVEYDTREQACDRNRPGPVFDGFEVVDQTVIRPLVSTFDELAFPPGPGQDPMRWTGAVRGDYLYPVLGNVEAAYLAGAVNHEHGEVLAVRFKLPTFPDTESGELIGERDQVRYTSICVWQQLTFWETTDCRYDAQLHPDGQGSVVVAHSFEQPEVDGLPYPDWVEATGGAPFLFVRHVDSHPEEFRQSAFFLPGGQWPLYLPAGLAPPPHRLPVIGWYTDEALRPWMGEYYPETAYCTEEEFATDFCGLAA